MTWLTPWTGALLAAAVIPPLILLYFLKLRRRTQPIACTLLWKRSVEDLQANAPFQRLRRNILLLLQLLALILLILSVMQPQVQAGEQSGGKTVIIIDNSASMTATDAPGTPGTPGSGMTRLEQAKQLARQRVEAIYSGGLFAGSPGETMIIAFSDRAEIYSRFSSVRQQLIAAIDRIEPTHGETRIAEALQLARAYTTNVVDIMGEARPTADPAHIELFSDGNIADLGDHVLRVGEAMTFHAIGTSDADNVAIANIAVERPFDRPTAVEVFASLLNYNMSDVLCDVQLSVNGNAMGIREVPVPAAHIDAATGNLVPGRNNVVFAPFEQPRDAVIEVANLRQDAMMADNVAQLVVPPPKQLNVALVSPQSYLIRAALDPEAMRLQRMDEVSRSRFAELAGEGLLDQYDVIVLDNFAPETLPPGRYLSFGETPPLEGLNEYGEGGFQVILASNQEHPVLRNVSLDELRITKMHLLQPSSDVQVLAEAINGPAIVSISRGSMHLIHVAFDPLDSTWPFQRSFINFIYNAVEHLGHIGEAVTSHGLRPGEALTTRLPAGAQTIELRTPDNLVHRLTPTDPSQLSWGPIRLSGAHVLSWTEPGVTGSTRQSRAFAVNLLSETEGALAVADQIDIGVDAIEGIRASGAANTPLWPWAIALCLALLMVEWWVYHRKAYF